MEDIEDLDFNVLTKPTKKTEDVTINTVVYREEDTNDLNNTYKFSSEHFLPGNATIYVRSWGCSHNNSDSEYMAGLLSARGYKIIFESSKKYEADLWLLNSCTVKNPSEQTFVNEIANAKKNKIMVVLAGCVPQASQKDQRWKPYSVIGVQQIDRIVEVVEETLKGNTIRYMREKKKLRQKLGGAELELPKIRKNPLIEIIPISTGCLNECTYCKTKQARGQLGSYPIEMIIERVKSVLTQGVVEIWLTSEDVGAYGIDIGVTIVDLLWGIVEAMEATHPYAKLRVGMTNPPYILEHVKEIAKILTHPRVYGFIHIPVQSGSDSVLDAMKRKYTIAEFKKLVTSLREETKNAGGVTIATDIICGFPTETPEDFEKTMELMREFRFPVTHISQFYPRPGTVAAKMTRIPTEEVKKRSREITAFFESYEAYTADIIGSVQEILVTEVNSGEGDLYVGHNRLYQQVLIPRKEGLLGKVCEVKIIKKGKYFLMGEILRVLNFDGQNSENTMNTINEKANGLHENDVKKELTPKFVRVKRDIISVEDKAAHVHDHDKCQISLEESLENFHFPKTKVSDVCCGGNGETCDCHQCNNDEPTLVEKDTNRVIINNKD